MGAKDREDDTLTTIPRPLWLQALFNSTGIAWLERHIIKERERRESEDFRHPYPEIYQMITSMNFEIVMGFLIVLNCLFIGIEASRRAATEDGFLQLMEHFFTLVFLVEWMGRMMAFGWTWIFDMYNFFDFLLVFVTGVLTQWVLGPIGVDVDFLRKFTVLRALRLVRLARTVRLLPMFKEMWLLLRGLTTSLRTLFWTMVMIMAMLYVFSIAAIEMIGKHPDFEGDETVEELFGDLLSSMFTMFQVMTLDTWAFHIVRPLMQKARSPDSFLISVFFVFFITLAVFVLMNLITAVIVENAFSIAKEDSEQQAKLAEREKITELKNLAELFLEIDVDGSGELTTKEFQQALLNPRIETKLTVLEMDKAELKEVWRTLDDGDGLLTVEEFTNGLRRMKGDAKAKDLLDMLKRLRIAIQKNDELQMQANDLRQNLTSTREDLGEMQHDMALILGVFEEIQRRVSPENEDEKEAPNHEQGGLPQGARLLPNDKTYKSDLPGNMLGKSGPTVMTY